MSAAIQPIIISADGERAYYRDYVITYWMKPIPDRSCDFDWHHKDYDGDGDSRCGHSRTLSDAKADIDAQIWEAGEDEDDV